MLSEKSDNTAIIWKNQRILYRELYANIDVFRSLIPANSKIALMLENRPEWAYAIYAAWYNHTIPVIFDFSEDEDTIRAILDECRPELIFVSNTHQAKFNKLCPKLAYRARVINPDQMTVSGGSDTAMTFKPQKSDDVALIAYTSGTTSGPRGVMLTLRNLRTNIEAILGLGDFATEKDAVLVLLPLCHIFPLLWTLLLPLYAGAVCVFSPSLEAKELMDTLADHYVSAIVGVPRLFAELHTRIMETIKARKFGMLMLRLSELLQNRKLSAWIFREVHEKFGGNIRYLICGGAAIDPQIEKDFRTLGFRFHTGYGMTETAPMIAFNPPDRIKIGSVGLPIRGCEIKTADDEIAVKGANVMPGYYADSPQTKNALRDDWLYTDDLGRLDQDGYLWITGRKNDRIVLSNGKNMHAETIEAEIAQLSDLIREVAVFEKNDRLHALVYPDCARCKKRGIGAVENHIKWEVIDLYNRTAPPFRKISRLILTDRALPRTALGKIRRYSLASFIQTDRQSLQNGPEPDFIEYHILKDYLQKLTKNAVRPDDHIGIDLGLDSLDRLILRAFVASSFGVKTDEEWESKTVRDWATLIRQQKRKMQIEDPDWHKILDRSPDTILPQRWRTHHLIIAGVRFLFSIFYNLSIRGTDNIPGGPVIYAANHQTYLDPFFIFCKVDYRIFRNVFYTAKERYFRNRFIKFLADTNQIILIDGGEALENSIRKLAAALKAGKSILIFPEGTRTHDGSVQEFKKTFAILSKELNVPVVPVALDGAIAAYPRGHRLPRPFKKIRLEFMEPVYPDDYDYDALSEIVFGRITSRMGSV